MAKSFVHSDCGKKKAWHAQIDVETIPLERAAGRVISTVASVDGEVDCSAGIVATGNANKQPFVARVRRVL